MRISGDWLRGALQPSIRTTRGSCYAHLLRITSKSPSDPMARPDIPQGFGHLAEPPLSPSGRGHVIAILAHEGQLAVPIV